MSKLDPVNVVARMPRALDDKLAAYAKRMRVSKSEVIRRLVKTLIEGEKVFSWGVDP